ncbi:hypothetical protein BKH36_05645 [Actinomyces naeslundii]|uniref:hypothetical protein n=2 Tax=Actinomyces naeslundii TaxID=1655 RepID=UPI00096C72E6|nr:hypothetical protein [Actinomyces naeslundii]OMG27325.1 hypothetical protein BKH36_05645 [Actinomyces naeslundii]
MTSQSVEAIKLLSRIEKALRELLDEAGGSRVDLETNSIALAGRELCWVTVDDQRSLVRHSSALSFDVGDLRRVQVDLCRGAWLWSHLWMEASDGVLHQECDWMREPVIGGEPVSDGDAAFELDQFPRDPQWVPEWMAVKAAAYHKEAEKRERRRQRDRERRARKKAEAAGAAEVTGEQSGSDASGQVDE